MTVASTSSAGAASDGDGDSADAVAPTAEALVLGTDDLRETIAALYDRALGRTADGTELDYWVGRLRDGDRLTAVFSAIATGAEAASVDLRRQRRHADLDRFAIDLAMIYRIALGRLPSEAETDSWFAAHREGQYFFAIVEAIFGSVEAATRSRAMHLTDGTFVQLALEIIQGRGASPREIATWQAALARGEVSQGELLFRLFDEAVRNVLSPSLPHRNDPTRAWIAGADRHVTREEWQERRQESAGALPQEAPIARFPFHGKGTATPRVSILTSLFRGGEHIDFFLRNIAAQSIFDLCELIIVDAASDELERDRIADFARGRDNVVYMRQPERIGIYHAWNLAIGAARGEYLTNANVDDCRRVDSIERQTATLDALPFVDVVHQDTFYSFEAGLPFPIIARAGLKAEFDNANSQSLMIANPPHNAPMWRRALHDDVGLFSEDYRSAGDYEFWLRCAAAGKTFYRLADPHASYYYNPRGVSTQPETCAFREIDTITRTWFRRLVDPAALESPEDFAARLASIVRTGPCGPDRHDPLSPRAIEWRRTAIHEALLDLSRMRRRGAL